MTDNQIARYPQSDAQAVIATPVDRDPHFGGHSYDASLLRELLAVIHRDGGHYVAQHGLEKACADAAATWLTGAQPAPAAQPADSAMAVLRELVEAESALAAQLTPARRNLVGIYDAERAMNKLWERARALTRQGDAG